MIIVSPEAVEDTRRHVDFSVRFQKVPGYTVSELVWEVFHICTHVIMSDGIICQHALLA